MAQPDLTSEEKIRALAADKFEWPEAPWSNLDGAETFYRKSCGDLCRRFDLKSRTVWNHYGSGYASYIDAWFYQDTPEFRLNPGFGYEHEYTGLWVLFHRTSPFYVMGEGEKRWDSTRGSNYLPSIEDVDGMEASAVLAISEKIERQLSYHNLVRLRLDDIRKPIPADIAIDTILGDRPYHLFDALFHWMD